MKNIITLITCMVSVVSCYAQLTHTSEFVKLNLPNGTYKVSEQKLNALAAQKSTFKSSVSPKLPYTYDVNGIILSMNKANEDSNSNDLQKNKMFVDELYSALKQHGNNSYTSDIRNVSKKTALVVHYITEEGHYRFYVQNEAKTLTVGGKIDYKESDSLKAEALLNQILSDIQFSK